MNSIINTLSAVSKWADKATWRTWVLHSLIAVPLALIFTPLATLTFYFLRECEQLAHEYMDNVKPDYQDHILDFVSPAVWVTLVWWIF